MHVLSGPLEPAPRLSDRIHDRRSVRLVLVVLSVLAGIAAARILTLLNRYSHYPGLIPVFLVALLISTVHGTLNMAPVVYFCWIVNAIAGT